MSAQIQPAEQQAPVARCKWCIKRIGNERYRFMGVWQNGLCVPLAHTDFTDAICPDCAKEYFPEFPIY